MNCQCLQNSILHMYSLLYIFKPKPAGPPKSKPHPIQGMPESLAPPIRLSLTGCAGQLISKRFTVPLPGAAPLDDKDTLTVAFQLPPSFHAAPGGTLTASVEQADAAAWPAAHVMLSCTPKRMGSAAPQLLVTLSSGGTWRYAVDLAV